MNTNKTSDEAKQRAANYMSLKGALEPKQETTLEEAAQKHLNEKYEKGSYLGNLFIAGAKWQAERMYSEEEVYGLLEQSMKDCDLWELAEHYSGDYKNLKEWFEQHKKK